MTSASEDFKYLIGLARDKSVEGRKRLVAVVSDIFFANQAILTEYERALITDILHKLIQDLSGPVRDTLIERLTESKAVTDRIVRELIVDDVEIAAPNMMNNEALLDVELIELVRHRALEHQLTLAMRRSATEVLSEFALEAGADVVKGLMASGKPAVVEATMAYLIDQARTVDSFQEPILRRQDLSDRLAKKMTLWILAALRQHILDRHEVDMITLDDAIEAVAEELVVRIGQERSFDRNIPALELAAQLSQSGEITTRAMIQALRQGEIPLFTAMMAQLTGLRLTLIRRLLFEPGGEGLVVACRAIGFEKAAIASIFLLCRRARPSDWAADPRELSRVLSLFDRVQPTAAQAVIARWRRDPDFLYAIKTVEEAKADAAAL
ncbi:MAG: DUF2336 domain-containing protein [Dongiaceae bacterium]